MRAGFPSYLDINEFFEQFKFTSIISSTNRKASRKEICGELIRSCGLKWSEFKIGNTKIFFRNGKQEVVTEKLKGDLNSIINRHKKLKILRGKWRLAIMIIIRNLCSMQNSQVDCIDPSVEMDSAIFTNTIESHPKINRKRKLYIKSGDRTKIKSCERASEREARREEFSIQSNIICI